MEQSPHKPRDTMNNILVIVEGIQKREQASCASQMVCSVNKVSDNFMLKGDFYLLVEGDQNYHKKLWPF